MALGGYAHRIGRVNMTTGTVKYEDIYLHDYQSIRDVKIGLEKFFQFYNFKRPHQSLDYKTPKEVHYASAM